jgi:tetratricopeptide (TPR) repeat protein
LYLHQGRFAESETLLTTGLKHTRRVRGEDSRTLVLMLCLAYLYEQQEMYAQADKLSAEALEGYPRVFGEVDYGTSIAKVLRVRLLNKLGETAEAEALLIKALEEFRRSTGEDHEFAYSAMGVLAETYHAQGRLLDAEKLSTRALEGWRRRLGETTLDNLATLNIHAELYLDAGRPEKAERLLIEAQKAGATMGDEGKLVAETAAAMARLRLMQQKPVEAEPPARRALAIRLDRHPDHWTRFDALSLLGAALAGQTKFAEAEPLLISGYEGLKEREARIPYLWRKKRPAEAGVRIVALYDHWGKKDKANEWRKRLDSSPKP